jgi:probable HAF family extracellular repeat protein
MHRTTMTGLALMTLAMSAAGVARPARAEILYTLKDLGTLGGTESAGLAVNDSGQVAGYWLTADGMEHAFLSGPDGGPLRDLGSFGGTISVAVSVNDSGQVAGTSQLAGNAVSRAFLSGPDGGPLKDLGTLGGASSAGLAVNASGQVAGYSQSAVPGNPIHAFLSGPGGGPLKDLGTLGGAYSYASVGDAVNASGQVVGASGDAALFYPHAFLYSGGQMFDLNDLIAPGSGFTLEWAYHISDAGYITGYGLAPDGQAHAFLLIPVPEPCGLVLLGTGTLGLLGYRARRRARPRA